MTDGQTDERRELDDLDTVLGPAEDQNEAEEQNRELADLPEEIAKANKRYDLDSGTQKAEGSIFKLALLIAAVVIVILLVVAVVWIF